MITRLSSLVDVHMIVTPTMNINLARPVTILPLHHICRCQVDHHLGVHRPLPLPKGHQRLMCLRDSGPLHCQAKRHRVGTSLSQHTGGKAMREVEVIPRYVCPWVVYGPLLRQHLVEQSYSYSPTAFGRVYSCSRTAFSMLQVITIFPVWLTPISGQKE